MMVRDLPQIRLSQPTHPLLALLEILVKLFTLGIFSVEEGAKAWFELVLVTAALCASGYILWWQIPLLIAAIILATLAAGMFSVLAPQYLEVGNLEVSKQVAETLQAISEHNLNEISTLSGNRLEQRLEQLYKAKQIFENNPEIVEQISGLQSVFNTINQTHHIADKKLATQHEAFARRQRQIEELEKQRRESEEKRQQEENERKRKEWEADQLRLKREAELKAQQERLRQVAREEEEQEKAERKRRWKAWLNEERRREKFTGGCPPDNQYEPPRCRPGYEVKVTLNKTEDGFDGIIWKPSDAKYNTVIPKWCYPSVHEAEAERGQYRFRRPRNSQGRTRP